MQRMYLFLLLFAVMLLSSACTKDIYTIEIDKNDKISFSYVYAVDKDLWLQSIGIKKDSADYQKAQEMLNDKVKVQEYVEKSMPNAYIKDVEIQPYSEGDFIGFKQNLNNIPFDEFYSKYLPLGLKHKEKDLITVKEGFLKNKYIIHLENNDILANQKAFNNSLSEIESFADNVDNKRKITYKEDNSVVIEEQQSASTNENSLKMNSNITASVILPKKPDYKVIIKIPYKAKKHNATNVTGNYVYEWDLFTENYINDIYIEYEKMNGTINIIGIFASLFVLLLFIGYIYTKNANDVSL